MNTDNNQEFSKEILENHMNNETLGEYLHKVRIMNRITLEKMAEETKLNIKYLEAIEKNEFGVIPGDTYIIIFLKNIAKYLDLEQNKIIAKYNDQTNKITQSVNFEEKFSLVDEISQAKASSSKKTFWTIIILIIFFFAVLFIVKKEREQNSLLNKAPKAVKKELNSESRFTKETELNSSIVNEDEILPEESILTDQEIQLPIEDPNLVPSVAIESAVQKESVAEKENRKNIKPRFHEETKGSNKLVVASNANGLLIRVFRNNKLWSNVFNKNDSKQFASDNDIYLYLSSFSKCSLELNGTAVKIEGKGKKYLKVTASGVTFISEGDWDKITK